MALQDPGRHCRQYTACSAATLPLQSLCNAILKCRSCSAAVPLQKCAASQDGSLHLPRYCNGNVGIPGLREAVPRKMGLRFQTTCDQNERVAHSWGKLE